MDVSKSVITPTELTVGNQYLSTV